METTTSKLPSRLDYGIKHYYDRLQFVIDSGLLNQIDLSKRLIGPESQKGGNDWLCEMIATYLFRSDDIGSERKCEYSFYRDEKEFSRPSKSDVGSQGLENMEEPEVNMVAKEVVLDVRSLDVVALLASSNLLNDNDVNYIELSWLVEQLIDHFKGNFKDELDQRLFDGLIAGRLVKDLANEAGLSNAAVYKRINRWKRNLGDMVLPKHIHIPTS